MAKHYYSFQFDMPYRPTYLRNWEVPKYYCPKPRRRSGTTQIISNSRGHLLPGVPRPPCNSFGDFIGTWEMPRKITRDIANKLNGSADKEAFLERCRLRLVVRKSAAKMKDKLPVEEEVPKAADRDRYDSVETEAEAEGAVQETVPAPPTKAICPIHDF